MTICCIPSCDNPLTPKSARGMCPRHYSYWLRTGTAEKPCKGCGQPLAQRLAVYCSDACKPRCAVENCEGPARKRGWCASHYHQARVSGLDPKPFKYKWNDRVPCLNCSAAVDAPMHRRFCTDNCRVAYAMHGGPRPTATNCVACGCGIDLTALGKRGTQRQTSTKFCRPCKQDYNKYKMSARELAARDGTDCGICGRPVDMTLSRADGLDCPSVDHILPRSLGGSHDPANLQLAHLRCNMAKSDRVDNQSAHRASREPSAPSVPWREEVVSNG
jgi:5-methylcytosine-specific restriction endonuclease McrA